MADETSERLALGAQLMRRKPISLTEDEGGADEEGHRLVRSFGVLQLTMISVGATLGTGILVTPGESVPMAGPPHEGGLFNPPAVVVIKIGILVFCICVAFTAFDAGNFQPLLPMGAAAVTGAASVVFFSYIGFDAVSTAGEEARHSQRDMPRAIMASMVALEGGRPERDRVPGADPHRRGSRRGPRARADRTRSLKP